MTPSWDETNWNNLWKCSRGLCKNRRNFYRVSEQELFLMHFPWGLMPEWQIEAWLLLSSVTAAVSPSSLFLYGTTIQTQNRLNTCGIVQPAEELWCPKMHFALSEVLGFNWPLKGSSTPLMAHRHVLPTDVGKPLTFNERHFQKWKIFWKVI